MTGSRQTYHHSDKVLINYETLGHGPTPLVFLHGFAAALLTWHDIAPREGCGHNPHEEKPEQTCAIIREFLETGEESKGG